MKMKKIFTAILIILCLLAIPTKVMAAKEDDIIIVIDPGHGGSQNGADYNGLLEKDINMTVSNVLVEELEKYDGIKVYLTHDSAEDEMSIKERADFAEEVNADYFFCIHFNASGNHNFYGAETWITSYGRYYSEMYAFSEIVIDEFIEMGLYNRGIKTKLETDGTDYYGVLRRCGEYDIPAVIIEHCHMDNAEDASFLDEEADLVEFGKADARAIAKFLGLKSSETGEDYSGMTIEFPEEPQEPIKNDETAPVCELTYVGMDDEAQTMTFGINASDDEHPILYYGYSLDGGETFTELFRWEEGKGYIEFSIDITDNPGKSIKVVVYNAYNLSSHSEEINLEQILEQYEQKLKALEAEKKLMETSVTVQIQTGGEVYLIIAAIAILVAMLLIILLVKDLNKKN